MAGRGFFSGKGLVPRIIDGQRGTFGKNQEFLKWKLAINEKNMDKACN